MCRLSEWRRTYGDFVRSNDFVIITDFPRNGKINYQNMLSETRGISIYNLIK